MSEEPPPAYQDTGNQASDEAKTDGAGATTKKERPPDEPAPDGEGVLSSPLRRMMFLGAILLFYYILSFWQPVYWMNAAANYCNFSCKNYPTASYGGCYESTVATCEDTCEAYCDILEDTDAGQDVIDTLYEGLFSATGREVRLAAFSLIVLGFCFAAVGVILAYFAVKKGAYVLSKITCALLGLGGLMSIIGAVIFLATWHEDVEFEETLAAMQIMVFIEYLLPGICGIILAVDVFNALIFNDAKKRMLALTIPFAVGGLMGGCLYAYVINWEPDAPMNIGYEFPLYDQCACIAAGYFILGLMSVARILVFGEFIKIDGPQSVMIKFVISILLFIGAFITAVGYWATLDGIFDCEYDILTDIFDCEAIGMLYSITGDVVGPAMGAVYDVPYEAQFKCYYVSYTFFILLITALNVYDMDIAGNYAKVRAAQKAAGAVDAAT